jgi:hypothetical protein
MYCTVQNQPNDRTLRGNLLSTCPPHAQTLGDDMWVSTIIDYAPKNLETLSWHPF